MLYAAEDTAAVLLIVACSLLFVFVLNRFWSPEKRGVHNDIIGWQLGILGTTYAVVLGFMLYTVWTAFLSAEINADSEANAVINVYYLANGVPDPQRTELKEAARLYADTVVQQDWPAMNQSLNASLKSREVGAKMWQILTSIENGSATQQIAEDHALSQLSAISEHRNIRQTQSSSTIPVVLWFVLVIGGVVTITSSCMLGTTNAWLHRIQVFAFSLLIGLVLVAIVDINSPFQGAVHVSDASFRHAQTIMKQE
jgi:hypothetical protein